VQIIWTGYMEISREAHDDLVEAVEDTIEYFCDQQMQQGLPFSGETAWAIIECLSIAKQTELAGELSPT